MRIWRIWGVRWFAAAVLWGMGIGALLTQHGWIGGVCWAGCVVLLATCVEPRDGGDNWAA